MSYRIHHGLRLTTALLGALLVAGVALFGGVRPAHAATLRDSIVAIAQRELNDTSRNYEWRGHDNCTYYAGQVAPPDTWPVCNSLGWRGGTKNGDHVYQWCAVFAKYVWREAGESDLTGLDPGVASFQNYGIAHGTWHRSASRGGTYIPQPGDTILFTWAGDTSLDHIGIVTGTSGGQVSLIAGNTGADKVGASSYPLDAGVIVGYTEPANAGTVARGSASGSYVTGDVSVVRTPSDLLAQYRLGSTAGCGAVRRAARAVRSAHGPGSVAAGPRSSATRAPPSR